MGSAAKIERAILAEAGARAVRRCGFSVSLRAALHTAAERIRPEFPVDRGVLPPLPNADAVRERLGQAAGFG